jgi:hypothetical protein
MLKQAQMSAIIWLLKEGEEHNQEICKEMNIKKCAGKYEEKKLEICDVQKELELKPCQFHFVPWRV